MRFSLYSDHYRSAASLSNNLKCLPSVPLQCDYLTLASVSPPLSKSPVPLTLLLFLLSFFLLLSFEWIYIFLSTGQGLPGSQLVLCEILSYEDVFLMHLWREKYSPTIYSSAILLSLFIAFSVLLSLSEVSVLLIILFSSPFQFSSVTQLCPTLCDTMNCSTPGLPVHHQLLEFTQTHVHQVGDAIQPSHPLSSPSPPALNLSQH